MAVGAIDQLVSVLRTQLAAGAAQARPAGGAARKPAPAAGRGRQPLSRLIELRVKSIAPDDPQRGRKAFRVFLEAVLLSEFGERLINDPGFYQMVEKVHDALETAPATAPLVQEAIGELLRQSK